MRNIDLFDQYLNGELAAEERLNFEFRLNSDQVFNSAFNEHKQLVASLKSLNDRNELKRKFADIHEKEFGSDSNVISIGRDQTFASRHGRTIVVAASTALIAVLSTVAILSTGGYLLKKQGNQITELKREVRELKYSSEAIVEGITRNNKKITYAPANLEGTAFALNNKGFILTSYHMVKDADSIFVGNVSTERTHAKLVFNDPKIDLAILKVDLPESAEREFLKTWQVPFSLKERKTDIGERVFTIGYPRKEMVYGEGSLSALSGYSNDTSMYQISIPVNPGNSGGPLLDDAGNIIGLIRGKITGAEATGFAIKASQILHSIRTFAPDSLKNELISQNSGKISIKTLKRPEQVKRINPYVFNVLVYKID